MYLHSLHKNTHFNPRKLDLLRNRICRRLANKNKHQPGNTLGQARSASVRLGSACSVNASISQRGFVFQAESVRLGSARLAV
jgi:hypothetical protein